jgi:hypothetical protein
VSFLRPYFQKWVKKTVAWAAGPHLLMQRLHKKGSVQYLYEEKDRLILFWKDLGEKGPIIDFNRQTGGSAYYMGRVRKDQQD